ncbi:MAG: flagellar basal body rod protein FlgB [Deltaproteobacteria bacterium]|nr:flagellar basal body rod protein FlgB [Deltaproteobacteria bacterium]
MPSELSFANTFRALERAIDIAHKRHGLIAGNISNLETPGYRAKEIDFRAALDKALEHDSGIRLRRDDPRHMESGAISGRDFESFEEQGEWNGYNWVNIDREMTKLIENNLRYRAANEILLRKINLLKEVIREGGR